MHDGGQLEHARRQRRGRRGGLGGLPDRAAPGAAPEPLVPKDSRTAVAGVRRAAYLALGRERFEHLPVGPSERQNVAALARTPLRLFRGEDFPGPPQKKITSRDGGGPPGKPRCLCASLSSTDDAGVLSLGAVRAKPEAAVAGERRVRGREVQDRPHERVVQPEPCGAVRESRVHQRSALCERRFASFLPRRRRCGGSPCCVGSSSRTMRSSSSLETLPVMNVRNVSQYSALCSPASAVSCCFSASRLCRSDGVSGRRIGMADMRLAAATAAAAGVGTGAAAIWFCTVQPGRTPPRLFSAALSAVQLRTSASAALC